MSLPPSAACQGKNIRSRSNKNIIVNNMPPSMDELDIVESDVGEELEEKAPTPMSPPTPSTPMTLVDDSTLPRQLTMETASGFVRKVSATDLMELRDELKERAPPPMGPISEKGGGAKKLPAPTRESKLLVIYTGGTIGMRCGKGLSGVYVPEQHYLPKAIREIPSLNDKEYVEQHYGNRQMKPYALPPVRGARNRVVYWVVEYSPLLDSSDMTFDDWIRIANDIKKSYAAYDGFVILHGTDTLAYTASALSFMLENLGKPVVVTGAQIPVAEVRSDGRENMIGALIVAGNLHIPEVLVLFNNKLLRGNRSTKMDNSGLDAFDSPNMAPIATMDISINVNYESIFRSPEVAPFGVCDNLSRKVVIIRIFPSMPIESVRASLRAPVEGAILQTFGSGNLPSRRIDILEEIKMAVKRGCLVVNVSQCIRGHVTIDYANGKIVSDAGVIFGGDITTEAALTKLAYVLGKKEWDLQMKRMMMQRNLRGELTVAHSEKLNELDIIPKLTKFLCITSLAEARLLRNALFPPLVCHAAHTGDLQLLENLHHSGANVSGAEDYNQRTALHVAAADGRLEVVEYLLKHGASVHARDLNDENALLCAVRSKNLEVVEAVRKAGGMLVVKEARIGVEMCLAAEHGDIDALKAWLGAGASVSAGDYDQRTALHVATAAGLSAIVEFLCASGANPLARDHFGITPMDECHKAMELGVEVGIREESEREKYKIIEGMLKGVVTMPKSNY